MKKLIFICIGIISSTHAYGIETTSVKIEAKQCILPGGCIYPVPEPDSNWGTLAKKYAGSLTAGTIIGALSGGCCAQLEKAFGVPFPFILITWFIFRAMRIEILDAITQDARKHKIDHHRSAIYNSAWIADWLTYFYCYSNKGRLNLPPLVYIKNQIH